MEIDRLVSFFDSKDPEWVSLATLYESRTSFLSSNREAHWKTARKVVLPLQNRYRQVEETRYIDEVRIYVCVSERLKRQSKVDYLLTENQ